MGNCAITTKLILARNLKELRSTLLRGRSWPTCGGYAVKYATRRLHFAQGGAVSAYQLRCSHHEPMVDETMELI